MKIIEIKNVSIKTDFKSGDKKKNIAGDKSDSPVSSSSGDGVSKAPSAETAKPSTATATPKTPPSPS